MRSRSATHVGHWDQCDALVDTVYREFGHCDVLVNNAGMSPLYPDLASITEDYYDKVHSVNLKGPFRLATQFGTRMTEGDGGSIINVSTIGSLRASGLELVYGCAKAGLNALTIGLADSFGPKVRANCILPGAILTDIAEAWSPETRAGVGDAHGAQASRCRRRLHRHRALARQRRVGVRHRRPRPRRRRHVPPNLIIRRSGASGIPRFASFAPGEQLASLVAASR